MSSSEETFELGVFLTGLAVALTHEQRRLDEEHARRLREFQPVLRLASELGYEEEARALAPMLMAVAQAEVGVGVYFSGSEDTEKAVGVGLINLRYSRRYKYSGFVENSLWLTVQSVPLTQAPEPQKRPA